MKLLFPIAMILLVIVAQIYISFRIWHILPLPSVWKNILTGIYNCGMISMIAFFAGAFSTGKIATFTISKTLYEFGTSWLFVALYLLIIFLAVDLLRLVHVLPKDFTSNSMAGSIGISLLMVFLFTSANIQYNKKSKETIDLNTGKPLKKPLRIVMLSDLHLGYHNERSEFARWVDIINNENPDLILIGGDIVDFSTAPLLEQHVAEEFHKLKAPVYACFGNHEYIGGEKNADNFYRLAGINLLRDEATDLPELGVCIVGRDDRTNKRRKKIPQIMEGHNSSLYTIVLDHQPFYLREAEQANIDFQFSGHTHRGQVWPITHIVDNMYECGYGSWKRGNTQYYISSGMGIWGGKFRIGTRSEYVVAELHN